MVETAGFLACSKWRRPPFSGSPQLFASLATIRASGFFVGSMLVSHEDTPEKVGRYRGFAANTSHIWPRVRDWRNSTIQSGPAIGSAH
jgi:hypothetical protein